MAKSDRKTAAREAGRARSAAREAAGHAGVAAAALLRDRWEATVKALGAAEAQVEKQVAALLKEKNLTGKDASAALRDLRKRLEQERKKAAKELDSRVSKLQARVKKERKAWGKTVDEAVQGALGAVNVPTRAEVARLTKRVEELSRRLERFRPGRGR